jgi:hypothetical protein
MGGANEQGWDVCGRCARPPRDEDDRVAWITIEDTEICPGCLTLSEAAALKSADQ